MISGKPLTVKTDKLLMVMMKFKIHPKVIDLIVNIYKEDSTILTDNNSINESMDITSGIRQGCNGSTVLFLMVTYIVIEELTKLQIGVKIQKIFGIVFDQSYTECLHVKPR